MSRRKKDAAPVCLCGECGDPVYSRGLGLGCYRALARLVRAERTTWEELIAAGQAKEAIPQNERRRTPARRRADSFLASRES